MVNNGICVFTTYILGLLIPCKVWSEVGLSSAMGWRERRNRHPIAELRPTFVDTSQVIGCLRVLALVKAKMQLFTILPSLTLPI